MPTGYLYASLVRTHCLLGCRLIIIICSLVAPLFYHSGTPCWPISDHNNIFDIWLTAWVRYLWYYMKGCQHYNICTSTPVCCHTTRGFSCQYWIITIYIILPHQRNLPGSVTSKPESWPIRTENICFLCIGDLCMKIFTFSEG